jgi:hypothetical protein
MPAPDRRFRKDLLPVILLIAFSFLLYSEVFTYATFGPEVPLFYFYNDGLGLRQTLKAYTYVSLTWYRPTPQALFYWIGQQFFHWHDLAGWKFFHFWTVLAVCCAIYWFVSRPLRCGRLAGILAAAYFVAQPSLYAVVMATTGFDFLHILLTILCAGCYLQAQGTSGLRSISLTALSWLFYVVALTSKEVTLAIPFYLLVLSLLAAALERPGEPPKRLLRETLRLLPFFALLPAYYFFHLTKIAPDAFAAGPYRTTANWQTILSNVRTLSLWTARIYCYTGETLHQRMYQSTLLNNTVGIATLALVAAYWIKVRRDPARRLTGLLMLAWIGIFLAMPIYAGGYLWHINLPVVGYSILFGIAAAWGFEKISSSSWRGAAVAVFFLGAMLLGRKNLKVELYNGVHATGFRINHSLLSHPPVSPERLGPSPLIYIEDRLGIGPWWYGCFGRLFAYVYLRHDLEEVIVPPLASVPDDLRRTWASRRNAFFFRYDEQYNWRDGSTEFRAAISGELPIQPAWVCLDPGGRVQFSAAPAQTLEASVWSGPASLQWSIDPPGAGTITSKGLYTAPSEISDLRTVAVTVGRGPGSTPSGGASVTLRRGAPIRVNAGGLRVTDPSGAVWSEDAYYDGGERHSTTKAIAGAGAPELYQSERFQAGPLRYRFCVSNGTYRIRLKFAEIWFTTAGSRVFNVTINGAPVLTNFDIMKEAGGANRALDRDFRAEVTDGRIEVQLNPVVSNPKISALEIVGVGQ